MSNDFRGTGNVGDQPRLKAVLVGNDERQVAELRVFFDEYRQDGSGGVESAGGFWLDVNVWGDRHAAEVANLVKNVGADPNLSHRADPILSQGRRPAVWSPAVDKCRSCSGSLTSVVVT